MVKRLRQGEKHKEEAAKRDHAEPQEGGAEAERLSLAELLQKPYHEAVASVEQGMLRRAMNAAAGMNLKLPGCSGSIDGFLREAAAPRAAHLRRYAQDTSSS